MRVKSLWRYPVKSMQGEVLDQVRLEPLGVVGDRSCGVLDLASGTIVSAKRDGRLLEATARFESEELVVRLPDGQQLTRGSALDAALSRWLDRPVRLVDAATFGPPVYESPEDFEHDDSALVQWEGPSESFVDESPLHVLTTVGLAQLAAERPDLQWDARRFRANVLLDVEAGGAGVVAPGQRLSLGDAVIELTVGCTRCVMTTRPQPGNLARQLDVLRHVNRVHANQVGVRASVVRSDVVRVRDPVSPCN